MQENIKNKSVMTLVNKKSVKNIFPKVSRPPRVLAINLVKVEI